MDIRKFKNANGILELYGSGCGVIRMKVSGEGHVLAMGPYLSAGVAW